MRYGNPSIEKGLEELREKNCNKIIVLPMYPHYCAATTGSTFDAVTNTMQKMEMGTFFKIYLNLS